MKTAEQMAELFDRYPQAIANAGFIAEQCNVELPLRKPLFPSVDLRRGETSYSRLWKLCFAGATRHYRPLTEPVISRLAYELEVIEKLGFSPYFLVVHDIVRFAHSRDIPILARGSAADSLVAYVLDITQVDPLAHNLLFERFLNPSRAEFELPDIDLDLCWRRRDEVLHYVYERYGGDHVATVGTHITFRLRSAWREVAKALGIAPERISYVASRLPLLASTEDLFEDEDEEGSGVGGRGSGSQADLIPDPRSPIPKLRNEEEQEAFELCKTIEGLPRHMGMHCAGVVISPGSLPLADLVPLARAARDPDMAITQYEKDAIESLGLVKMDLLGSRALTTLVDTVQAVVASGEWRVASDGSKASHSPLATRHSLGLEAIPFDDERTYKMMAEGETLGCFQLESPGMRALLKWLRPRSLNDVTAAISLFRPGPLEGGFMEAFMRRHLGLEPVSYPHPAMEPILKDTYGVILYQEQFLRLAHDLAGLDLGEAEKLRKKLGEARTPEERARLGSAFVAGAIERGIDQMQAEKVWEIIAGYTGFGFCQAHACSYAVTAYRGAYMKAHYPAQFLAAQLNNQGGYYGPCVYVEDARRLRIKLLPPHVNESGAWCEAGVGDRPAARPDPRPPTPDPRSIRIGLQFVQGLSGRTIAALLTERQSGGPFRSLVDLMERVEMTLPEARALVKVGACDGLGREEAGGREHSEPRDVGAVRKPPLHQLSHIEPLRGSLGEPVGAFHRQDLNRRQLLWLLPQIVSIRSRRSRRGEGVGFDLFSQATGSDGPGAQAPGVQGVQVMMGDFGDYGRDPRVLGKRMSRIEVPNMDDYSRAEKLRLEREVLGFALSGNEMELYQEALNEQGVVSALRLSTEWGPGYSVLSPQSSALVTVAGTMVAGRRHLTKGGEWMLFMTLQDLSGLIEVVLFPDAFRKNAKVVANGGYGPYLVRGQLQVSGRLPSVAGIGDRGYPLAGVGIGSVGEPIPDPRSPIPGIKMHPVVIADEVALLS